MRGWTEQFLPKTQVQFWLLICHRLENTVPKNDVSEHHMAGILACEVIHQQNKTSLVW